MIDYEEFKRWLKAAYLYYITPGEDPGMSDYQWDMLSKFYFANREILNPFDYGVVHHPDFEGGSLFFLRREEYPDWCKE